LPAAGPVALWNGTLHLKLLLQCMLLQML
jgi:hypothetical protein